MYWGPLIAALRSAWVAKSGIENRSIWYGLHQGQMEQHLYQGHSIRSEYITQKLSKTNMIKLRYWEHILQVPWIL